MRHCSRCGAEHPPEAFRPRAQLGPCCWGTPARSAKRNQPRACIRCHEIKSPEAFPIAKRRSAGPVKYRRRSTVCEACRDAAIAAAKVSAASWRVTWKRNGRLVRRCSGCREIKDVEPSFYVASRDESGAAKTWQYICKRCQIRRLAEWRKRVMADPVMAAQQRANHREWRRKWRKRNPEADKAMAERYREGVRRDPVRMANRREVDRMAHYLRRQRDGLPTFGDKVWVEGHVLRYRRGPIFDANPEKRERDEAGEFVPVEREGFWITIVPRVRLQQPKRSGSKFPARPLAKLVRDHISSREGDSSVERLAQDLGISLRVLCRWESGEIKCVRADTADTVLTRLSLNHWDVWPEEEVAA